MADNTAQNGTATIAADDVTTLNGGASSGVLVQRVKAGFGDDGTHRDASDAFPFPVALKALAYPSSANHNSSGTIAIGTPWVGTPETIQNMQAAQVEITCDQPYTVEVKQYIDSAGVKLVSTDTFTRLANQPLNENITLPGNYFSVRITNNGQVAANFSIDTTFGIMDTQPRALTNDGNFPVAIEEINAPQIWRTTFAKSIASGADTDFWQGGSGVLVTGSGQAVSQSGGNLVITTGTTVNAETILRSVKPFDGTITLREQTILSQRIANQSFFIELVDVIGDGLAATASSATALAVTIPNCPFKAENVGQFVYVGNLAGGLVGVPNRCAIASVSGNVVTFTVAGFTVGSGTVSLWGWNHAHILYDGATATTAKYDTQRNGWNSGDTAITIATTASPGHMAVMAHENGQAFIADQLVASATGNQLTIRGSRVVNLPNESAQLYVQIRVLNGSTAPASTTTWTVGTVSVEEMYPLPVTIQSVRPMPVGEQLPVNILGGTLAGVTAVTTVTTVASSQTSIPSLAADVASAALTTTTTTAAFTPTWGSSYEVNIPVTAVTGTTPTLDVVVQESDDNGTTWFDVYHFPRITATGNYRSPKLQLIGTRVRYVQTVGGTTPSFTRAVNRLQSSDLGRLFRQIYDRSIVLTSTTSATAAIDTQGNTSAQLVVNLGAVTTTAPAIQIEGSDDHGATWYAIGTPLTGVASSSVQTTVNNIQANRIRARVSTAGVGATLGYLCLKSF